MKKRNKKTTKRKIKKNPNDNFINKIENKFKKLSLEYLERISSGIILILERANLKSIILNYGQVGDVGLILSYTFEGMEYRNKEQIERKLNEYFQYINVLRFNVEDTMDEYFYDINIQYFPEEVSIND